MPSLRFDVERNQRLFQGPYGTSSIQKFIWPPAPAAVDEGVPPSIIISMQYHCPAINFGGAIVSRCAGFVQYALPSSDMHGKRSPQHEPFGSAQSWYIPR